MVIFQGDSSIIFSFKVNLKFFPLSTFLGGYKQWTDTELQCSGFIQVLHVPALVTKQTRARPRGTLMHDPTISVEENTFLFTGFQPWRGQWLRAHLHRALLSHNTQPFPYSPPGCKPKPRPEVPPILICSSASCTNRSPYPLPHALVGFRVAILLQQPSP